MGNTQRCMYCKDEGTENNPILESHSLGKRNGQLICFNCIKEKVKIILELERRLREET